MENSINPYVEKNDLLVASCRRIPGREYSAFPKTRGQFFLFLLVLLNSGIFASVVRNPFGIKGVSEALEIFYVAFALHYLWGQESNKGSVYKIDFSVFGLVMFAFIYSAGAALIMFGQPFYYGLIEERRILIFLVYFPLAWGIRKKIVSVEQIFSWVVITALICGVLSVLVVSGIIPQLKIWKVSANVLREERFGIGSAYIAIASLILLFRTITYKRKALGVQLLFLIVVLLTIIQTRQVIIALLVSSIFLLGSVRFAIWSSVAGAALVVLATVQSSNNLLANLLVKYHLLFQELGTEKYLEESARALTIGKIVDEFSRGAWLGSGGLSALWNGGFGTVYGQYFFLTDVGLFGSIYKFGIFAFLLYGVYLSLQYKLLRASKKHLYYRLIMAIWVYLLVIFPVAATIEYCGSLAGLLLAVSLGCTRKIS